MSVSQAEPVFFLPRKTLAKFYQFKIKNDGKKKNAQNEKVKTVKTPKSLVNTGKN